MRIRTPADLGALIRGRRTDLGLDQKSLAATVGVSRQWVVEVEKGKSRAEVGLILRTLEALGVNLSTQERGKGTVQIPPSFNIDTIVAAARTKRK